MRILDVTSIRDGVLIKLDSAVPDNCAGTPYGWMLIPDKNKTILSVALLAEMMGVGGAVYTSGIPASRTFCTVTQFPPTF